MSNFNTEKEALLSILLTSINRLLFPTSVINSLKKYSITDTIAGYMKCYNSNLIKTKSLYKKLLRLEKWGIIFNSHILWKISVNKSVSALSIYSQAMLDIIKSPSNFVESGIFSQYNIHPTKLLIFMNIIKKDQKYVLFNPKDNKITELTEGSVLQLLPACFTVIDGNPLMDPTNLEIIDLFQQ